MTLRAPSVLGLPLDGTLKLHDMRGEARGGWAKFDVAELSELLNPVPSCHLMQSAGSQVLRFLHTHSQYMIAIARVLSVCC